MIDHRTSRTTDEVSEADLVEQSTPVHPDESDEPDLAAAVDRDTWSANTADVIDQSIPVPLDDEDAAPEG
ncbi:hypothetical protein ACWEKT_32585 [Nocardia takedensis]